MTPCQQDLYQQVFAWCWDRCSSSDVNRPIVIGVNGPQGAGKSTLARGVVERFRQHGKNAATISIDDFYWSRPEQQALAERSQGNRYLQQRGYPGTHDLELGVRTLQALLGSAGSVAVPQYDKSSCDGRGDRMPADQWPLVSLPLDVILWEGWMLGFNAVEESQCASDPELAEVNRLLVRYGAWWGFVDEMIWLTVSDHQIVHQWRLEAERMMRQTAGQGMTDRQVIRYIDLFMPAYRLYSSQAKGGLRIALGAGRSPLEA